MAWSENASTTKRPEAAYRPTYPATSAEDLQQRLDEFGLRLQQLKDEEPVGPSREWLDEAERRYRALKSSLEDYRKERTELSENESTWETAKRNVHTSYDSLADYTKTGAQNIAEGFRKSWDAVTSSFNRAFGRDQGPGPKVTSADEYRRTRG
jgi:hypothetical protein